MPMNQDINSAKNEIKQLADYLLNLSPQELSLLSFAMGFILSPCLTINQQNAIGNFFILFGQVMLTFNAQSNYLVNLNASNNQSED